MEHYILSPDIFGDRISFIWDNDLWLIPSKGSYPVRLTAEAGIVTNSRFSPDGKYIAFRIEIGADGSSADLYTIRLNDGRLSRLTYVSGKSTSRRMFTDVAGWTPDNKVVISTDAFSPFGAITSLYTTDPEGGPLIPLNYGPASNIIFADGSVIIGRNTVDMPHWKGYKGGTSGVLWKGTLNGKFEKFLDLGHHISSPLYLDGRVYFISDQEGTGNLYSISMSGSDKKKHTEFSDYHARNAKSDGKSIVFQHAGDIYTFNPKENAVEKTNVDLISSESSGTEKFPDASKTIEHFSIDSSGEMLTLVTRGISFTAPFRSGPVVETGRSGEHVRFPTLANGNMLFYISDASGEEDLYIKNLKENTVTRIEISRGIIECFAVSKQADKVVFSNNRGELFSADIGGSKNAEIATIDKSEAGIINDISISPNGTEAAYSYPEMEQSLGRGPSSIVKLYSFTEKNSVKLSESGSRDFSPTFSKDGDLIYFLSTRSLDPSPDNIVFDFSFPVSVVLNAIPLSPAAAMKLEGIPPAYLGGDDGRYPLNDLMAKVSTLSLKPSQYLKVRSAENGLILLEYDVEGMSKYYLFSKFKRKGRIIKFNPMTGEMDGIHDGAVNFKVSSDGKKMVVSDQANSITSIDLSNPSVKNNIKFDISRIRLRINLKEEWKQMLEETKRLVRENYWSEKKVKDDYSGAFGKYDSLIGRVGTRFELSDLLREFQGEFRTSHSYEVGGDISDSQSMAPGKLGIDGEYVNGRYVVKHILKANFSNEGEKSPAFNGVARLREGDVIRSIDGIEVSEKVSPENILYNRGNDFVRLEIERGGDSFSVFVKTMSEDRKLRYREWVENNREYIHQKTGGRVGYIHIPDMGYNGFAEFTRLYPIESKKDALIVDVRYNGGGSVSQLLLEKLAKKRVAYSRPRRGEIQPYPAYSVNGPMLALTNQNAGSDGDIFTHAFKLMKLGPVIGTRTWGGVVGINPRHMLVDGTMVTQPQFAFWFKDVGYGVENYGSDPTIEVHNSPSDWHDGIDRQLETGIEKIMEMLKESNDRLEPPE